MRNTAIGCVTRVIGVLLILALLPNWTTTSESIYIEVKKGNIFKDAFTEPFEIIYIVFYDGDIYKFSTHHADRVQIGIDIIINTLEQDGKQVADIAMFIHNHWAKQTFTEADMKTYHYLIGKGFKGAFLLWVAPQKLMICLMDGKDTTKQEKPHMK